MFRGIENSENWEIIEPVEKGWSSDVKYKIITKEGECLLLRLSAKELYAEKKKEFEMIQKYARLGFPMSQPLEFGICDWGESVYMLLTWVEGKDLEEVLADLPISKQYELGREAGRILKKIHSLEVAPEDVPRETKKPRKLWQLAQYEESQVRINGDEEVIAYVRQNIDLMWKEKPVYMHGDYHPGNLIYTPEGKIGVIDFNRWEVGDPYEEFYKLESFGIDHSIPYSIGQIDAYFEDKVPEDFWKTLAVYVAHTSLFSIKWAEKFGQKDIDGMVSRCRRAMENYDGFRLDVPKWYKKKAFRQDLTLVNYCHPDCEPMLNIMRLPEAEAYAKARELADKHPETTAFYRFADFENYYPSRKEQDAFLYARFQELGGKPEEEHPLSFVVQGSDYLKEWFGGGIETRLALKDVEPCHISFTIGDSGYDFQQKKSVELLTVDDLYQRMADYEDFETFLKSTGRGYVEVQLWSDKYVK